MCEPSPRFFTTYSETWLRCWMEKKISLGYFRSYVLVKPLSISHLAQRPIRTPFPSGSRYTGSRSAVLSSFFLYSPTSSFSRFLLVRACAVSVLSPLLCSPGIQGSPRRPCNLRTILYGKFMSQAITTLICEGIARRRERTECGRDCANQDVYYMIQLHWWRKEKEPMLGLANEGNDLDATTQRCEWCMIKVHRWLRQNIK